MREDRKKDLLWSRYNLATFVPDFYFSVDICERKIPASSTHANQREIRLRLGNVQAQCLRYFCAIVGVSFEKMQQLTLLDLFGRAAKMAGDVRY